MAWNKKRDMTYLSLSKTLLTFSTQNIVQAREVNRYQDAGKTVSEFALLSTTSDMIG